MALRALRFVLRYAILLLIAVYFLMAGFLLATKYWFLPRVDSWRPDIEVALTNALGTPVKIRQLQAQWYGLTPTFEISGLVIENDQGHEVLVVPRVEAVLSWRSLTTFEPRFQYIGVDDLALAVVHNKEGVIQAAGFSFDLTKHDENKVASEAPWYQQEPARWLLSQGQLSLNNATLLWIDEQRDAAPLQIENLSLNLQNRLLSHRFEGRFDLASSPDQQVEFVVHSDRLKTGLGQMIGNAVDGEIYVALSNVDPQSLSTWVDVPAISGRYAARSWIELSQGRLGNFTVDVAAQAAGSSKQSPEQTGWLADHLNLHLSGAMSWLLKDAEYAEYVVGADSNRSAGGTPPLLNARLHGQGLTLLPPDDVIDPLKVTSLNLRAGMRQSARGNLSVNIQELKANTPDGTIAMAGRWQNSQQDGLGDIDLKGSLTQVDLTRLYHYMPKEVGSDVIDWLKTAFIAGEVTQASFVARGPVALFPYATQAEGDFTIDGTISNWGVDYAPAEQPNGRGWPVIQHVSGSLHLNRDLLSVTAQNADLMVANDAAVTVPRIEATLRNLYSEPVVEIRADTESLAANYETALTKTALADVVPSFVADLRGGGTWNLGLDIVVPLEDVEKVDFKAALNLNGGSLRYGPLPPLENVTGTAVFTDEGFQSEGLTAQLLGSELTATGAFGTPGQSLKIKGAVQLLPLYEHFKIPVLNQWLKGVVPLEIALTQPTENGPYVINGESDMVGVQWAFPAPLVNASGTALKSQFNWVINPAQVSVGQGSVKIGNLLHVQATGRESRSGSLLSSVAIGIGAEPIAVSDGLSVNIAARKVGASEWESVFDRITKDLSPTAATDRATFPALASVRLNSNELLYDDHILNDVVVNLQAKENYYSAQFRARQTNGSASWQMRNGDLVGSLHVRLAKLELGEASSEAESASKPEAVKTKTKLPDAKTLSTIPPLDLIIEDLVLNGVKLGRLEVVGENDADKRRWNVEKLAVSNKNIQATATGQWSFDYTNPGVRINANMNVTDLGEALTILGVRDQVRRGRGTIKAQLDWQNFPWDIDYSGLSGKVQVDLDEGIFVNIHSGSARVLELLSLQSFGRLLDMNINRGETFSNGFPWNTIEGNLVINRGEMSTEDLVIVSPVARIAFHGGVSLNQETLQLRATVKPNLDLSGAAMATGFLLNPIVGLSALVGNYILRNPIENILSLRYDVSGPWSDPKLNEAGSVEEPLPGAKSGVSTSGTVVAPVAPESLSNANLPSGEKKSTPDKPVREQREVYRIELGKDSGFDPSAR